MVKKPQNKDFFIWETHGIHVGTAVDPIKHGINQIEFAVNRAIELGFPGITFIIHTPRLTKFRYQSEINTDIKFIRGDTAYFNYAHKMESIKKKYKGKIQIRYGIELEWLGEDLGRQWNRSKIFQVHGVDFVIGSVHFSNEGLPYDGSREETDKLIQLRGGLENYWHGYIEEMIEMIDAYWDMLHIVGHLDLPKIFAPMPKALFDLEHSSHFLARRLRTLLEMISDYNFAIDLNTSGLRKGCGIFPEMAILEYANKLGIQIGIGTDAHFIDEIGQDYHKAVTTARKAGYKYYVSFSKGIHEKRPFSNKELKCFQIINLGIEILNNRFTAKKRLELPRFSFGGDFRVMQKDFIDATTLGDYNAVRVRKEEKSVTLSSETPKLENKEFTYLFSHHTDIPGTLSILFNTLASEGINVETAYLNSLDDGTATAYLTCSAEDDKIREAVEFIQGTASTRFFKIEYGKKLKLPAYKKAPVYILEVDGVDLAIAVTRQMLLTVHNNRPGVLLILLSALASRNINIKDLQLGSRGDKGFAILGLEGDQKDVAEVITKLGPQFYEVSHFILSSIDDILWPV